MKDRYNGFDLVSWNGIITYYYVIRPFMYPGDFLELANRYEIARYIKLNF